MKINEYLKNFFSNKVNWFNSVLILIAIALSMTDMLFNINTDKIITPLLTVLTIEIFIANIFSLEKLNNSVNGLYKLNRIEICLGKDRISFFCNAIKNKKPRKNIYCFSSLLTTVSDIEYELSELTKYVDIYILHLNPENNDTLKAFAEMRKIYITEQVKTRIDSNSIKLSKLIETNYKCESRVEQWNKRQTGNNDARKNKSQ